MGVLAGSESEQRVLLFQASYPVHGPVWRRKYCEHAVCSGACHYGAGFFHAAAEGGILSLTHAMAREFGKHKIRVNAISPGVFTMMDRTLATMPDAETVVKRMTQAIPLQRLGTAEDIAKVVLFLASPYADYISGTSLVVDGGLLSKLPLPEYW
jgi:NAD(P)-dependent dehydrogenase (short-subunit alcohol dehydrogenase family)